MFASTKLAAVFSVLAAAAAAVSAAPAKVFEPSTGNVDVVFRPHITAPTAGVVWQTGSSQVITWDAGICHDWYWNSEGVVDIASNTIYPWNGVPHQAPPPPALGPRRPPPPPQPLPPDCPPWSPILAPSRCGGL